MNKFINRHNKNCEIYWNFLISIKNKTAKEMSDMTTFYDYFRNAVCQIMTPKILLNLIMLTFQRTTNI